MSKFPRFKMRKGIFVDGPEVSDREKDIIASMTPKNRGDYIGQLRKLRGVKKFGWEKDVARRAKKFEKEAAKKAKKANVTGPKGIAHPVAHLKERERELKRAL